jgi:hypothetical protein
MKNREPIDYGNVEIKKLPPGKAFGADDLRQWSHNRAVGASGVSENKTKSVLMRCKACGGESTVIASRYDRRNRRGHHCHHCGKRGVGKVVKKSRIKT